MAICSKAKECIVAHHKSIGYCVEKGYVKKSEDNLINGVPDWASIKGELERGFGNELESKFNAVYSSTALCVNNFAFVKHHIKEISLFGASNFNCAEFEKPLENTPTRGRFKPDIDFYLRNDDKIIGIESKFIEILQPKLPNYDKSIEKYMKYFDNKTFDYLPEGFKDLMEYYMKRDKLHLGVAQLLKHMIGLFYEKKETGKKKATLVYLYWLPTNWKEYEEYQKHEKELDDFKNQISVFSIDNITFKSYSYPKFWKYLRKKNFPSEYLEKIEERYSFELNIKSNLKSI